MNSTLNNQQIINKETEGYFNKKNALEVKVFHAFEEIAYLQNEWDGFVESVKGGLFLTYDWCRIWWKYYGKNRDLKIFLFRHKGVFCGILPLFIDKIWLGLLQTRVIKIVGSDFSITTVTLPIKRDFMREVIERFLNELTTKYRWDILSLGPVCGRYDSFDSLVAACNQPINNSYRIQTNENGVQTYFKVAESWEKQISNLSRENRRGMKRSYERIIKEGTPLKCFFASKENFNEIYDNFVQMHQAHWKRLGKPGHFGAWPMSYDFHREVAGIQLNLGRLRLYRIELDGRCIGYHYAFKFGDTYYYFLFAREQFEKSEKIDYFRIDFGEMVKQALKESVKWFDTMQGRYEYELRLGGELYPIRSIYIFSNKFGSRVKVRLCRSMALILDVCYYKIWRRRIAPGIRWKLGSLWEMWIRSYMLSY